MNAVLRRGDAKELVVVEISELRIDRDAHRVEVGAIEIPMTPLEFKLLLTLVLRRERVQTRSTLLGDVWEFSDPGVSVAQWPTTPYLKTSATSWTSRFRFIQTVRGVGYRFSERQPEAEI